MSVYYLPDSCAVCKDKQTAAASKASAPADVRSFNGVDAGDRLAAAVDGIRFMLYGLALDARQACIAQKAIDEAVDAARTYREWKASTGGDSRRDTAT